MEIRGQRDFDALPLTRDVTDCCVGGKCAKSTGIGACGLPVEGLGCLEHLLGAGADADVFGEVFPADYAGAVD